MANPLRKTMVYLGLADEELEYDEAPAQAAPVAPVPHPHPQAAPAPAPSANRAPVTPLRKTSHPKNVAPAEMNEILTVHPKQYKDAQVIAENFREGIPVIINLSQMTDADARRLIDFAGGLSQGLYGKIERVTSKVFLLSPSHVAVSGDAAGEARAESSFFVQS
jgi:cell division inhibitor SepF